jgi:hypothetical protein
MAVKNKTYSSYLIVALIALFVPMMVTYFKYTKRESNEDKTYNKPNLVGIVINDNKPEFSWKNWFNGSYQTESDDYNNDHWAYKEIMVRLNNQFYYKAFNQLRVNNFVSGKDDYVFSEGYIFSAFGDDLMKEEKVKDMLKKAKVIQDTLKKKGIDLLFVYAPGKGEYLKEFIEDKYVHPIKNTNLNLFVNNSKALGVNYLDLYTYFNNIKPKAKYPLFPKFGHHWSFYGECLSVDTIIKHIEKLHHCNLPEMKWNKIEVVDSSRSRDADVLKSMNLYSNPKQNMQLAYPELVFEEDSSKNTTKVLTISDSYWYGPVYAGVPLNVFAGGQFWYYYNKVIPSPTGEKVEVWEMDLKKELESNQVIMLLYSDGNLPLFGNNFIYDAYEMYTSPKTYYVRYEKNKKIQYYAKEIRNNPALLKKSTLNSGELRVTLDSAIKIDAMKMAGLIK